MKFKGEYKLIIMMEKAGTRLVQARKNHPKRLSMPLWSTTMMFEIGLLLKRVAEVHPNRNRPQRDVI
jgi:hypothetical protein